MHLPRHTLSSQLIAPALVSATFTPSSYDGSNRSRQTSQSGGHLTCVTRNGFLVAKTWPLKVVARKDYLPDEGALSVACTVGDTSLLLLVGGGRVPRYAPNKVVIWDENATLADASGNVGDNEPTVDSRTASTVFDAGSVLDDEHDLDKNLRPERYTPSTASSNSGSTSPRQSHSSDKNGTPPNETATTDTNTTRTPRRGKEVMELEFDQVVKSVCVRCFPIPSSRTTAQSGAQGTYIALIVVVLDTKALLFELGNHIQQGMQDSPSTSWNIKQRATFPAFDGGRGIVDMVRIPATRNVLLAMSGRQKGHVQLVLLSMLASNRSKDPPAGILASSIIAAHSGSLVSLCISPDGALLATASSKGTLIRVWSTLGSSSASSNASRDQRASLKTVLKNELRRGTEQVTILSMAFNPDRSVLAAASDKGTIHFFNLSAGPASGDGSGHSTPKASTSGHVTKGPAITLSKSAAKYLPLAVNQLASQIPSNMIPQYLKSQWSTAQFRIKLQSFAAHRSEERAERMNDGRRDNITYSPSMSSAPLSNDSPRGNPGVRRSTEGAWATLKGRIEDIKKWEPALDERIFLTWVAVPVKEGEASTQAPSTASYHLIALTSSGSWYRISLTGEDEVDDENRVQSQDQEGGDTVLGMYKEGRGGKGGPSNSISESSKAGKSQDGTVLEEYHVLGKDDEWGEE